VPAKKSRKTINNDDDDDFVDDTVANSLRAIGEFMNCGKCEVQFTVVCPSSLSMFERDDENDGKADSPFTSHLSRHPHK
jgi:hypothetical protein